MSNAVIGIGNVSRGDDGVGHALVDELQHQALDVTFYSQSGEASALLDIFGDHETVIVIDAMDGPPPGEVRVINALNSPLPAAPPHASTHSFGLAEAVALGASLGQLPEHLWVVAIAGENFEHGHGISRPVRGAMDDAAKAVLDLVGG